MFRIINRKIVIGLLVAVLCLFVSLLISQERYEYATNDPFKARIYTLNNGLKVYLSSNKDEPRIQTRIVVRVGSKNDPPETTGLSHYLEHLMFNGTKQLGTMNYDAEKPYLDKIEELYEVYRKATDPEQRKNVYHEIDTLSRDASKYAISNEYSRLMDVIGSTGSNAYTSYDRTVYVENIPSNEIENWAKIEADRFKNMVVRGFHTELEVVYEEYNKSLLGCQEKIRKEIKSVLFPNHPYGLQSTLGKQEHLKNPSIKDVKTHFNKWYVPNNVAICMSGDLDYNKTIKIIKKYFSDWKPNPNIKEQHNVFSGIKCDKIVEPVKREVFTPDKESVVIGWAIPGESSRGLDYSGFVGNMLFNGGGVGLIDRNVVQNQKVLGASFCIDCMSDYSIFNISVIPKSGQTLDEAKDIVLKEVQKLKKGDFNEDLITATINNVYLLYEEALGSNKFRVDNFVYAFVNQREWKQVIEETNLFRETSKDDVVSWANKYLTNGYVCVYKRKGECRSEGKVEKPIISPIEMNRGKNSAFANAIINTKVAPIEPVFVDYKKDLTVKNLKNGDKLLYKKNVDSELFVSQYIIYRGQKVDKTLDLASAYVRLLGTPNKSNIEIKEELYKLACSCDILSSVDATYITLSGLSKNMSKAMKICYEWLMNAKVDKKIYDNMVFDTIEARKSMKTGRENNFSHLVEYGIRGPKNVFTDILSEEELKTIDPQMLLDNISSLFGYKKTILYYGPLTLDKVEDELKVEILNKDLKDAVDVGDHYPMVETSENEVFVAPYDAESTSVGVYFNEGQNYDITLIPKIAVYDAYIYDIVKQELRDARGLAYSVSAHWNRPSHKNKPQYFMADVATQNDKLRECITALDDVIENMPIHEHLFQFSKNFVMKNIAARRIRRFGVLMSYISSMKKGLSKPESYYVYEKVKNMKLKDLIDFHKRYIKNRARRYLILLGSKDVDSEFISKLGRVHHLSQRDIYGY